MPRPLLRPTTALWIAAAAFGAAGVVASFRRETMASGACEAAAAAFLLVGLASGRAEGEVDAALRARLRETRALEERMTEQRRTVDALADGLDAALFICDRKGTILYANPPAMRLFGSVRPAGATLHATTLSPELETLMIEAADADESVHDEIAFVYPFEWIGLASAWREPAEDRVFVSVYEITELRRLERLRKDFVANVSHELRTPMTIIRGYAETLLDDEPPKGSSAARMLPRIIAEVDRLTSVTQDLLLLSVSESSPVVKEPCDLAEIVRGVTAQLGPKAQDKELVLTYSGEGSLPMQGNAGQIGQVAINLVDNALNYTSYGGVDVSLHRDGEKAVLTVRDTGIGIDAKYVERVFERFYRVDRGRSRATGGTGLGLSIVRHIVEAHGGSVRLESVPNRGSTFTVTLPLA